MKVVSFYAAPPMIRLLQECPAATQRRITPFTPDKTKEDVAPVTPKNAKELKKANERGLVVRFSHKYKGKM